MSCVLGRKFRDATFTVENQMVSPVDQANEPAESGEEIFNGN
jgi:hypothetical protein